MIRVWLALATASSCLYSAEYHSPHVSDPVSFQMSTIDARASGAYGLVGHDISERHDGAPDLVSFAYSGTSGGKSPGEIYWYQFLGIDQRSPRWRKHLITRQSHVVHGDFADVDGDGHDDLIFMSDFEVPIRRPDAEGSIWWAQRPARLDAPEWKTFWIGRAPGAHRIVTADLLGDGKQETIVVPLFGPGEAPVYGATPLTLFQPGADPKLPWQPTRFTEHQFHAIHDVISVPRAGGKGRSLILAAAEGVLLASFDRKANGEWTMQVEALHGEPQDRAGDLTARDRGFAPLGVEQTLTGKLAGVTSLSQFDPARGFLAAIDYTRSSSFLADQPWHGDTVSVYFATDPTHPFAADSWRRVVLEKRAAGGHAVQVADFNHDGCPDVIAGFRAYPTAIALYLCDPAVPHQYHKQILSERSGNSLVIGDWNHDGRPDFASAGFGEDGDPYVQLWLNKNH